MAYCRLDLFLTCDLYQLKEEANIIFLREAVGNRYGKTLRDRERARTGVSYTEHRVGLQAVTLFDLLQGMFSGDNAN